MMGEVQKLILSVIQHCQKSLKLTKYYNNFAISWLGMRQSNMLSYAWVLSRWAKRNTDFSIFLTCDKVKEFLRNIRNTPQCTVYTVFVGHHLHHCLTIRRKYNIVLSALTLQTGKTSPACSNLELTSENMIFLHI
jgi:hypothetical protein